MATRIRLNQKGSVALLALDGDNPLNLIDRDTLSDLADHLDGLAGNKEVNVVLLTGSGTRAFSAGANLDRLADLDGPSALAISELGQDVTRRIARLPCPVIAAIHGVCFGGGLELALACDLRLASNVARFSYPASRLGILPGWGGTQRCPAIIGVARAKELMYLGRVLDARTALSWGLIHEVVDPADLDRSAADLAEELAGRDAHALRQTKACLDRGSPADFTFEREAFAACFARPEVRARLAKWKQG